jgi:excisionase family DNA binding protein
MVDRLTWRVVEVAEALGISRAKAYELIAVGEIPSVRIGGCLRVPVEALRASIARRLETEQPLVRNLDAARRDSDGAVMELAITNQPPPAHQRRRRGHLAVDRDVQHDDGGAT